MTRQFTLQNPDGSFPTLGVVLGVIDDIGTVQPVTDISLNTLTAAQMNITGIVNQNILSSTAIAATNVSAGTLTTTDTLTANDVSANRIFTTTSNSQSLNPAILYTPTINNLLLPNSNLDTIQLSQLNYGSIVNTDLLEVSDTLTTQNLSTPSASFSDVSVSNVTSQLYTASVYSAYDISATNARFTSDVSAQTVYVSGRIVTPALSTSTVEASTLTVNGRLNTKYIDLSGDFTFANAILTSDTNATHITSTNISTNSLYASSGVFTNITAAVFDVSGLNSIANINSLVSPNTIVVKDTTTATTTTVGNLNATTATIPSITSGSATTTTMTTAAMTSTTATTRSAIAPNMNIGGVPVAYSSTAGLTINGVEVSNISKIAPELFHEVLSINNLQTIADISATLSNSVDTYNSLLEDIFTNRFKIMVDTATSDPTPSITFNSPASMQFVIGSVTTASVTFNAGSSYTLQQLSTALNAVCGPNLTFVPRNVSGVGWNVAINVSVSAQIADMTNTPTGSLQLLRYFGHVINDTTNLFENYALSTGGEYTMTPLILNPPMTVAPAESYKQSIQNTLSIIPNIIFSTVDSYTISFQLTNGSDATTAKYLCLYNSFIGYKLYDLSNTTRNIGNLPSNIGILTTATFLDSYNSSKPYTMLWQTTPIAISATAGINTITVSWLNFFPTGNCTYTLTSPTLIPSSATVANGIFDISYNNLAPNTTHTVNIYGNYTPGDNSLQYTRSITVTTLPFVVSNPIVTVVNNSTLNIASGPTIAGNNLRGTLTYRDTKTGASVTISSLSNPFSQNVAVKGTGRIDCSLNFTDGVYSATSGVTQRVYDTSFGFYNQTAISPTSSWLLLDAGNNCGYSFVNFTLTTAAGPGPFVGNSFNKITFSQAFVTTGNPVVQAIVYQIPYDPTYAIWSPQWSTIYDIATATFDASSNTSFSFTTPITITNRTTVLFRITSGSGTVRIPTFNQRINNPPQETQATAITYNSVTKTLTNGFATTGLGCICQFSLV